MPPVDEWETFPFDGDIRARTLEPRVDAERPRHGEGGVGCRRCERGDETALWRDESWRDILPPTPEDVWRANLDAVARALQG
jgi:hypothetical protein